MAKAAKQTQPGPPPVVALVGGEGLLQLEAIAALLASMPAGAQRTDIEGETAELADVLDDVRSGSLFAPAKLVVVRNADTLVTKYRQLLEDYVAAPAETATLVLRLETLPANQRLYKAIAKSGEIIACQAPKDLPRWIIERAKSTHQLMAMPDAARLLAELVGADLARLDNELAKLALVVQNGRLTANDVAMSVAFQRERQMWDLTNALGSGDAAEAVRRWRQLLQSDSSAEFRAVTWLVIWLENVRKALEMLARGQGVSSIGQTLRIWPQNLQQPFVETAKSIGQRGVWRALDLLAEVDRQSKSGVGTAATNVERFILTMAQQLQET